jgi:hypothetical protein
MYLLTILLLLVLWRILHPRGGRDRSWFIDIAIAVALWLLAACRLSARRLGRKGISR